MFEIYLTGDQLIRTIRISEGHSSVRLSRREKASIMQLIDQVRFIVTKGDITKVQTAISSISEEYIYWSSIHLSYAYADSVRSPFSIELSASEDSIFNTAIAELVNEHEIDVSTSAEVEIHHQRNKSIIPIINEASDELVLYDPYLFDDYFASVSTIHTLAVAYLRTKNPKITLIGGSKVVTTDTKLKSIVAEIESVFGSDVTISLLKINDVYHDREFISNLFRIKSGDSFNWKKKKDVPATKARGSTIITMSNLLEKRLKFSSTILNKLFTVAEARYHNKHIRTTTAYEMTLSENFFKSNFYNYWKSVHLTD